MITAVLLLLGSVVQSDSVHNFTTYDTIHHQITMGLKSMCVNQRDNGQFLYEVEFKEDHIEIDPEENNMPRQAGGLYAVGLYYRLNHQRPGFSNLDFSITDCIDNAVSYLSSLSVGADYIYSESQDTAELIDGNTGATALALLGMIEICIADHSLCRQYLSSPLLPWIEGLLAMRRHKMAEDGMALKEGAFSKNNDDDDESSEYYDAEAYLAVSRLVKYRDSLYPLIPDESLWDELEVTVRGVDEYFMEYTDQEDTHWLLQSWYCLH